MKKVRPLISSFIFFTLLLYSSVLYAQEDPNDVAYQSRFALKAGTILNSEGKGDSLIFPYYDVRTIDGNHQITQIQIQNFGEYGIAAKLRVRGWLRGREVFSIDIWIPSSGVWTGTIAISEDGSNALLTSSDNVISSYGPNSFSLSNSLSTGSPFSKRNILKNKNDSTLYGFIEVIGEEGTSPDSVSGLVGRLAKSDQDCPNTLTGSALINRVEDGVSISYDAVAIGNFSRGQGSLFRSIGSLLPTLATCEDTLDQLEFQLSKCEMRGSYSLDPSTQSQTSIIVTFPTKNLHYKNGNRINQVDNPFEASKDTGSEVLGDTLSEDGETIANSEISLPFAVNVIGLYEGDSGSLTGIDNVSLFTGSSELGEAILTSYNLAQRLLIPDFEDYFPPNQGRFSMYKGLPAVGLVLQESQTSGQANATFTPVGYSRCLIPSTVEVIITPTVSGPTFGLVGTSYTFTASGGLSSLGNPIQYFFDWGDGTNSGWLPVGTVSASKSWTNGGVFTVRVMAMSAINTSIVSKWSNGLAVTIDSVSAPTLLVGPIQGIPNQSYSYTASGAASTAGDPMEYQFDWGDGTMSQWGSGTQSKAWAVGGPYNIRARASSATHPTLVSDWTATLTVTIELISVPSTPVGPNLGNLGTSYSFSTGGAVSNLGYPVQYQFDWGDGTFSPWGSSTQSKSWNILGTFLIKARARSAIDTTVMSDWSSALTFDVETISIPAPPTGPINGMRGVPYTYTTTGAVLSSGHTILYQFDWNGDGTTNLSLWGAASQTNSWTTSGVYTVRVRAQDSVHPTVISGWSSGLVVVIEFVNSPTTLTGPTSGTVGQIYAYVVGGSSSDRGDPVQYQFDWGDGTNSGWLAVGVVSVGKAWVNPGIYTVKAQARSSVNTNVISDWCAGLTVTISAPPPAAESVSTPATPVGPSLGNLNTVYSFSTGGSISTLGNPVQYQFDWGDGTFSSWGSSTQSRSWSTYGSFLIRARASTINTNVMSDWSSGLTFVIELVTAPSQPYGPLAVMRGQPNTYKSSGAISNIGNSLNYQFDWTGNGTDLSGWIAATIDPVTSLTEATAQAIWTTSGTYVVRARAQDSTYPTVISDWSSGLVVVVEFVNPPITPTGTTSGTVGIGYFYATGGSSSDRGDPVQYQFDWGDGTTSEWLPIGTTGVGQAWTNPGTYAVRAHARSGINTSVISDWSAVLTVTINPGPPPQTETISTPWIEAPLRTDPPSPDNAIDGVPGTTYTYTASGGLSNLGNTTQYQFNWGDGTLSPWGGTSETKAWSTSGIYNVTVIARDASNPTVVSATSSVYSVAIEYISPPSTPTGPLTGTVPGGPYTYTATGATSAFGDIVQYRFHWGDGNDSGWQPPAGGVPSGTGTQTASHTWALPGQYTVWVEARSATNIGAVSIPSSSISVTITP